MVVFHRFLEHCVLLADTCLSDKVTAALLAESTTTALVQMHYLLFILLLSETNLEKLVEKQLVEKQVAENSPAEKTSLLPKIFAKYCANFVIFMEFFHGGFSAL